MSLSLMMMTLSQSDCWVWFILKCLSAKSTKHQSLKFRHALSMHCQRWSSSRSKLLTAVRSLTCIRARSSSLSMRVILVALNDEDFRESNDKTFKSRFKELFFFENLIWSSIFTSYLMTIFKAMISNILFHSASMKSSMNCSFQMIFDREVWMLIIWWVIFHFLLWSSFLLIAFFSNCSKSHILKKLLAWVSTKVDHSIRLSTRRQTKILSVESAIRFFNFIVLIFEVESSLTMSLTSLFSLQRRRVSSSSNWAISADWILFSCDIWALTWSAAFARRWSSTTWVSCAFFAALKLSMICSLKLRRQLTLTAASAVFALTAASTMILAATSALALRAASALALSEASALALPEGFFVGEVLEGMSESSRDSFWLRRDDDMMASGIGGAKRISALWKVWTASNWPVWFFYWFSNRALRDWECQECLNSIVNLGGGATIAMPRNP